MIRSIKITKNCLQILLFLACAFSSLSLSVAMENERATGPLKPLTLESLEWAGYNKDAAMAQGFLNEGHTIEGNRALHCAAYHKAEDVLTLLLTHPYAHLTQEECQALFKAPEHAGQTRTTLVTVLVARHFDLLLPLLKNETEIIGKLMTPYDAASDIGYNQSDACKKLLDPQGFKERLTPAIEASYHKKLELFTKAK